ncbi:MAG: hypothetical protein R3C71_05735 [Candidatus Krumholzibacteriia bacterium]|nr:hypothetical protein [bacterium]MCB9513027.1 hypothetical protein [Candidatus Latescibacterota bacterium]MCB9516314.1 hypothetical protein [Candidatus Latescibacterota bacterium]
MRSRVLLFLAPLAFCGCNLFTDATGGGDAEALAGAWASTSFLAVTPDGMTSVDIMDSLSGHFDAEFRKTGGLDVVDLSVFMPGQPVSYTVSASYHLSGDTMTVDYVDGPIDYELVRGENSLAIALRDADFDFDGDQQTEPAQLLAVLEKVVN